MTTESCENHADLVFWCSNATTSQNLPFQLLEGLSSTQEDLQLFSLSHCILPINLKLPIFRVQHKALVLFLFFSTIRLGFIYRLLQLCLLSGFRKCAEVTSAETEKLKGVRPRLHHLTFCLNPCKQRTKDMPAHYSYTHLLRKHRPIKAELDRYHFFNQSCLFKCPRKIVIRNTM